MSDLAAVMLARQPRAHTPRLDALTPPASASAPETVESSPGNALTVTLGDCAFLVGVGVVLTLTVELAAFIVWAGWPQ